MSLYCVKDSPYLWASQANDTYGYDAFCGDDIFYLNFDEEFGEKGMNLWRHSSKRLPTRQICHRQSVQDWKVEELAEDGDNWKIIVEIANDKDETSVEQKLGDIGERLKSTAPVDRVFPKFVAPKGRVHIVVHEDSDLDEESGTRKKEKQTLKTLTSLLASSILQPPAVKVPSHKFYDRNQAKKSMLKVARLERLNDVWESSEETNMHQNQIQYNINYNNSRHTQAIKELG
ncbi:hypothetical protein RhiirA4_458316 [Rhizophagus irregularis]|uniref:Uncharacterized protein n=1 Tax=Rhizophagus irregularis TaxID=588596 RepID=A0A2I1GBZ1_9GLOM|nr:hypothetical protein RhiirA4_458316 [Rhizophagus irregularis]